VIAAAHRVHRLDDGAPDCTVCRRPSRAALRERWGCDRPAVSEVFRSTCTECHNTRDDCETCGGSGSQGWYRCPSSQTDDFGMMVAEVAENLTAWGEWPDGKPWQDQPNSLYEAVKLYRSEVGRIREAQRESAQREAESARRAAQAKHR